MTFRFNNNNNNNRQQRLAFPESTFSGEEYKSLLPFVVLLTIFSGHIPHHYGQTDQRYDTNWLDVAAFTQQTMNVADGNCKPAQLDWHCTHPFAFSLFPQTMLLLQYCIREISHTGKSGQSGTRRACSRTSPECRTSKVGNPNQHRCTGVGRFLRPDARTSRVQ